MTNNVFGIIQYVYMYSHFFIDTNSTKLTYGRMRHIIKEKPAFQDHIFIKLNCVWEVLHTANIYLVHVHHQNFSPY